MIINITKTAHRKTQDKGCDVRLLTVTPSTLNSILCIAPAINGPIAIPSAPDATKAVEYRVL